MFNYAETGAVQFGVREKSPGLKGGVARTVKGKGDCRCRFSAAS